jgi:hypothetical protein
MPIQAIQVLFFFVLDCAEPIAKPGLGLRHARCMCGVRCVVSYLYFLIKRLGISESLEKIDMFRKLG